MGRRVDTSWYDTYVHSRAVDQPMAEGPLRDPEMAGLLGLKPKTWARVKGAGRFLDGLTPPIERERIQCGYAPLERLAKLWSSAPDTAQELLDAVLRNQLKLADLETLIRGHAQPLPESDATRPSRNTAQKYALFNQLEAFFDSSKLHPFDTYKGRVLRRRGTLGSPAGYYLCDAQGELKCLVLCIQPSAWRDPATAARELYEHALAQRHLAPAIWFVFERDNVVLQRLAELSLYWGGSPYDKKGHWLFLSHLIETGYLQVLFEDHFAQLIERINAGQGLIEKTELFCTLEALDGQPPPKPEPLRPLLDLPKPNKTRTYREVVQERIWAVGNSDSATNEEKRGKLEVDLDL
jgi:hypothetical protein